MLRDLINLNKKRLLAFSLVSLILSITVFSFLLMSKTQTNLVQASSYGQDQIILKVNEERQKHNLSPLRVNNVLNKAAQNKADDMVNNSYFSHVSPVNGKKWSHFIKSNGYVYLEAGENLATGYNTVQEVTDAWMNSPLHKENILSAGFTETGVAFRKVKSEDGYVLVVVQLFGRQDSNTDGSVSFYYESDNLQNLISEGSLIDLFK